VNYGLPDDYDKLAALGIDVKGKIVIAKYGRSWRGIKPKVAQEHGAVGCIIYTDPMGADITREMFIQKVHLQMNIQYNAAVLWICPFIPVIH
jgi:hypothetical protein